MIISSYEQLFITDEETVYRTSSHAQTRARAREGFHIRRWCGSCCGPGQGRRWGPGAATDLSVPAVDLAVRVSRSRAKLRVGREEREKKKLKARRVPSLALRSSAW
jgi:hypothetical protein